MIKQISISDIPGRLCKYNNTVTMELMEFYNSDWEACEVNLAKYKNAHSASGSFKNAIKKSGVSVVPVVRDGRLFLVRKK